MTKRIEPAFGKTFLGQMVYDLLMVELTPRYLGRKYHMTVAEIRHLRKTARKAYKGATKAKPRKRPSARSDRLRQSQRRCGARC